MKRSRTTTSSILVATFLVAASAHSAAAQAPQTQRQNLPEIPAVARRDAICFAYCTVNRGLLKLTAQLYPPQDGESREAKLEILSGKRWQTVARARVTEENYSNYRREKTWTAHFRVEKWNESRTVPYRVTALEGFGNKLTMFTYANPTEFPAPLTNLAASASGHGVVRFNKEARTITMECWPRGVDVTQPAAKQYPEWPITVNQLDNFGRKPVAWLPEIQAPAGVTNPVVQVVDERGGEVVYTLRAKTARFRPWVFAEGSYTVRIGEPPARMKILKAQRTTKP